MNKRGPLIGIVGTGLIALSFGIAMFTLPQSNPTMGDQITASNMLEGMFDKVSTETTIFQGRSQSFSYTIQSDQVHLMWGLQITDYQRDDSLDVSISRLSGMELAKLSVDDPIHFDAFIAPEADTYNFEITNTGDRPVSVTVMFSENPENEGIFSDPNSPFSNLFVPIMVSGFSLIVGLVVTGAGIVLMLVDWKKSKNESRYI
ncbi:MAG: hypothetical protein GWN01_07255 [Nitrosopumilaceae archaeon]|nr:hypothetical protein [Nitrosopumilaceae archaeon]NIU00726.1 hypothetical protein [Nitrosopumilaceae archaeon]NIU87158.1 hypothetical protein [Nitrosopumilaceae archaeon]NIV65685.1 hypothetical protein [Nitrosopumilaceae archaeon]NIX61328.1 hypothetical protein [Nitrosopumilaceae archaeon]